MAKDALSTVNLRATPQTEQADPRQVRNSEGGYVFQTAGAARLHRFLTLGVEGGTFYVNARKLAADNAKHVIAMAKAGDETLVPAIVDVSQAGRAPKNDPALFALAIAASLGTDAVRKAALDALPLVARTGSHLESWAAYAEQFRGWGRGMRRAVGNWYLTRDESEIAYQYLKYKQRGGWAHRDLLRSAHPLVESGQAATDAQRAMFDVICGRTPDLDALPLVAAAAKAHETRTVPGWVALIRENPHLTWEMFPSEALGEAAVWEALFYSNLPMGALIRNLPRLTNLGLLKPFTHMTTDVCNRLTDAAALAKARVHPVSVLVAQRTYSRGEAPRGKATWTPVPMVTDALDAGFYAAFGAVEPSGVATLLAVDVSSSMTWSAAGEVLMASEAAAAMALVTAATEPQAMIMGFADGLRDLNISPRMRLDDVLRRTSTMSFGGTDCALPMDAAMNSGWSVQHFSVYTDNETHSGYSHPHQALEAYRRQSHIPARMSVVGMTATDFTIADPADPATMDVAGFDAAVPKLLADFGAGRI